MSTEIQKIPTQEPRPRHEEVERRSGADPQTDRHGGQRRVPQEWDRRDRAERPDECRRPTHGGFYKHFESKDQLVAEACAEAVETILEILAAAASEKGGAAAAYLSADHRD